MARKTAQARSIVIDKEKGWVFSSEGEVVEFFHDAIETLHEEFSTLHQVEDFDLNDFPDPDIRLQETLISPDEIWEDRISIEGVPISIFIKKIEATVPFQYVALTYLSEGRPSFVFTHFPTRLEEMTNTYRRTEMIYNKDQEGVIEFVDALASSDRLAVGLYQAMLKVRSDTDIPENEFDQYQEMRVEALETPDEVWKSDESSGIGLVRFIREFQLEDRNVSYIVVTAEEPNSKSHYVLFSFPTNDPNLVDRYRRDEKLDPQEFVREESH